MKIEGSRELIKALKKRKKTDQIRKAVTVNSAELQKSMQKMAPVDTGFMRRSIRIKYDDFGMTARVGPNAQYAPYVEYGTRYMAAQPFVRPSFNKQKKTFIDDLNKLMK